MGRAILDFPSTRKIDRDNPFLFSFAPNPRPNLQAREESSEPTINEFLFCRGERASWAGVQACIRSTWSYTSFHLALSWKGPLSDQTSLPNLTSRYLSTKPWIRKWKFWIYQVMEGHETWVVEGPTDQSVDSWILLQLCLADYKLLFPGHAQNSRQDHSNDKQLPMILQASFLLCKMDAQLTDSATCNLHQVILQELTFCNMMLWLKKRTLQFSSHYFSSLSLLLLWYDGECIQSKNIKCATKH
jgi:hypothetical protein